MNTKQIGVPDLPGIRGFVEDMVSSGHRFRREFEEAEALPEKKKQMQRVSDFASYGWRVFWFVALSVVAMAAYGNPWLALAVVLVAFLPALVFSLYMSEKAERLYGKTVSSHDLSMLISSINYLLELFDISAGDLPCINSGTVRERLASQAYRILKAQRDIVATDGFQGREEVGFENHRFKMMFDTFKYFGFISPDEEYGPFFEEARKRMVKEASVK